MTHTRCLSWSAVGALLGLAAVAHAQDPSQATDPASLGLLVELVQGGGLPAVLALLGWLAGRWGGVPVVLSLHPEDRKLLEQLRRRDDHKEDP